MSSWEISSEGSGLMLLRPMQAYRASCGGSGAWRTRMKRTMSIASSAPRKLSLGLPTIRNFELR
jgi:hypothetical protein